MTIVSIPEWNTVGLLPPINQANPISPERSPYNVALLDAINSHLHQAVQIDVTKTQVGNGRPRYFLAQMPHWTPS